MALQEQALTLETLRAGMAFVDSFPEAAVVAVVEAAVKAAAEACMVASAEVWMWAWVAAE